MEHASYEWSTGLDPKLCATYFEIKMAKAELDSPKPVIWTFKDIMSQLASIKPSLIVYLYPCPHYTAALHKSVVPFQPRKKYGVGIKDQQTLDCYLARNLWIKVGSKSSMQCLIGHNLVLDKILTIEMDKVFFPNK